MTLAAATLSGSLCQDTAGSRSKHAHMKSRIGTVCDWEAVLNKSVSTDLRPDADLLARVSGYLTIATGETNP